MTVTNDEIEPLSIDHDAEDEETRAPLDIRILDLVRNAPDRTIRPAFVAAELGISVNDAAAELCGLLAAVGGGSDGALFTFENIEGQHVMAFSFPLDFEQRALRKRRRQDRMEFLKSVGKVGVKFLKTITAFGLILSLLILSIAAVAAMIAAIVAMSNQQGNHRQRNALMFQLRSLFLTIREMLWCYAVFGPTDEGTGQDPFLREVAYDLSLVFGICCGNPGSIFFWMRANQLSRRSRRRGWVIGQRTMESEIPGVMLNRNRDWQGDEGPENTPHRGLLSTAVEFLFGPIDRQNLEAEHWKLRAAVLIEKSTNSIGGVSLTEMSPFVDYPPPSFEDSATVVEQGLRLVSYFNGIPQDESKDMANARFIFPELMSESSVVTRYQCPETWDDGTFSCILCKKDIASIAGPTGLPKWLSEERRRFTVLSFQQFSHCLILGLLNLLGVIWFGQTIAKGGVLEIPEKHPLEWFLKRLLLPTLRFYAALFFTLPFCRLGLVSLSNIGIQRRNQRRANLSKEITAGG